MDRQLQRVVGLFVMRLRDASVRVPTEPDGGREFNRQRRLSERTTPRSIVFVAAVVAAGIGVVALTGALEPSATRIRFVDEASYRLDSFALAIGLFAIVALWTRQRVEPDDVTVDLVAFMAVTAIVILPAELIWDGQAEVGVLTAVGRLAMIGVVLHLVFRRRGNDRQRLRRVTGIVVVTLMAAAGLEVVTGPSASVELREIALGLSAGAFVMLALPIGAQGLRSGERRVELLALTLIAFGITDSVAVGLGDSSVATLAGKGIRLFVLGAWLTITLFELVDLALRERQKASEAAVGMDEATVKLAEELRRHERVVHDVTNALLAIQGGLRSMGREAPPDPLQVALESEVERLRATLEDLRGEGLPVTFDVGLALRPMVECYRAAGAAIELIVDGRCAANARELIVMEVVQNLIDNAVKHGGGAVAIWVFTDAGQVHVRVGDRGEGVSEARRSEIFERHASTGWGSGVGLHIARRLAESQGGGLTVENRSGGGAVFALVIPQAEVTEAEIA